MRISMIDSGAIFSPCKQYRYSLWRRWAAGPTVMFIGLNPSTADETVDDPTICRCIGFAQSWGFAALHMTNLFAWRATDPDDMKAALDPVGPANDHTLRAVYLNSTTAVAAWGTHGTHLGRGATVRARMPALCYLRLTKDGHPAHPLYLPKTLRPTWWCEPLGAWDR